MRRCASYSGVSLSRTTPSKSKMTAAGSTERSYLHMAGGSWLMAMVNGGAIDHSHQPLAISHQPSRRGRRPLPPQLVDRIEQIDVGAKRSERTEEKRAIALARQRRRERARIRRVDVPF